MKYPVLRMTLFFVLATPITLIIPVALLAAVGPLPEFPIVTTTVHESAERLDGDSWLVSEAERARAAVFSSSELLAPYADCRRAPVRAAKRLGATHAVPD